MNKTHIFDLDGTLIDSMPVWARKMLDILDEEGVEYPSDIIKIITPLGGKGTAEYFIKLGVKAASLQEIVERMGAYVIDEYIYRIPAKEGVPEYLMKCKADGDRLCVLTASPHITTDPCLRRLGMFDLFDYVWSAEDFSLVKSDARIYKEVLSVLGCKPDDVIFYDDNPIALKIAASCGIETVGVYDETSAEYESIIKETVNRYIRSFSDLV